MRLPSMLFVTAIALGPTGCSKTPPPPPAGVPPADPGTVPEAAPVKPGASPAVHGSAPTAAAASPTASTVKGKVAEVIDAASYTYLRITTGAGDTWAAVPHTTSVKVGAEVVVDGQMTVEGFESKTLNRKFDRLVFGTLPGQAEAGGGPAPAMPPTGMAAGAAGATGTPPGHPPMAAPADVGDVKVAKAAGADARTVAEVWAGRAGLKGKPVVVHGKVVKFNGGVMGRNWLHLRDGSGSDAAKDNDLTVTTSDAAQVGDVITVRGTIDTDKDFGAGYTYAVIVEQAKIEK